MKLETIILLEVTQAQKDKSCIFFLSLMDVIFVSLEMCFSFGIPTKIKNIVRNHCKEVFSKYFMGRGKECTGKRVEGGIREQERINGGGAKTV